MKTFKEHLDETSLSRVYSKLQTSSVGFMTAFRDEYTKKENRQRNHKLKAQLQREGYLLTAVKGNYIEDYDKYDTTKGTEVAENTFLVVSQKEGEDLQLEKDLIKLGNEWEQDSILSVQFGKNAFLIGTKKGGYPGKGVYDDQGKPKYGKGGEFFSRINGRKMSFMTEANGWLGRMAQKSIAEKDWREIDLEIDLEIDS